MALNTQFARLPFRSLRLSNAPILHTPGLLTRSTTHIQTRLRSTYSSESMPRIAQTSVWTAMIPPFIRRIARGGGKSETPESKEWNPASFYIIIFILIGSQAIRMMMLKKDYAAYTRSTDAKIELLREVIEKVKRGEQVDVEKLLGTGDAAKEREWEEVLREIEDEDSLWHQKASVKQAEQEQRQEVAAAKEPVIPAEGEANTEPPKDSSSRRKLNFF